MGLCEISVPWASKTRIQFRFNYFQCVPHSQVLRPSVCVFFFLGGKLRFRVQNQDSANVYLDSHLSLIDWCWMEVRIIGQPERVAKGCAR